MPTVWVERYATPTWLEYIRHNNRLTQEDANIPQRLHGVASRPRQSYGPPHDRATDRSTAGRPRLDPRDLAEPLTDPSRSS